MKRAVLMAILLSGCAQQPAERPTPAASNTTVYRFTSHACEKPEPESAKLKAMTQSRDDWKRYAERLEKLPASKPAK